MKQNKIGNQKKKKIRTDWRRFGFFFLPCSRELWYLASTLSLFSLCLSAFLCRASIFFFFARDYFILFAGALAVPAMGAEEAFMV